MTRALLAVGCSAYDGSYQTLVSPETDAASIFAAFTSGEFEHYSLPHSRLLLSPTKSEFESTLSTLLYSNPTPDIFTIYCAGHGDRSGETYYYCVRDSNSQRLSLSAISISFLFDAISERRPQQVNLILDTCHAGGVGLNLAQLTKTTIAASLGTPSITLFASAAFDEAAYENDGHGIATGLLLRYVRGQEVAQTSRPYLDLIEVGRLVSKEMMDASRRQTPFVWGLNLHGLALFARNPAYRETTEVERYGAPIVLVSSLSDSQRERIQSLHLSLINEATPTALFKLVTELRGSYDDQTVASLLEGLAVSFVTRAEDSADQFLPAKALAVFIAALCSANADTPFQYRLRHTLLTEIAQRLETSFGKLLEGARADNRALLSSRGGLSDLTVLPLRLSMILGWAGLRVLLADDNQRNRALVSLDEISNLLVSQYGSSLVSVSDEQAPFLLIYFSAAASLANKSDVEVIFGYLFDSLVACRGYVLHVEPSGKDMFEYASALAANHLNGGEAYVARPTSLIPVLLWAALGLGLEGSVDPYLSRFDRQSLNMFVPSSYSDFGKEVIRQGLNIVLRLGFDFWRCSEFQELAFARYRSVATDNAFLLDTEALSACLISSLVLPDRVCWHIAYGARN